MVTVATVVSGGARPADLAIGRLCATGRRGGAGSPARRGRAVRSQDHHPDAGRNGEPERRHGCRNCDLRAIQGHRYQVRSTASVSEPSNLPPTWMPDRCSTMCWPRLPTADRRRGDPRGTGPRREQTSSGKSSPLGDVRRSMGSLEPADRPLVGEKLNEVTGRIQDAARRAEDPAGDRGRSEAADRGSNRRHTGQPLVPPGIAASAPADDRRDRGHLQRPRLRDGGRSGS